VKSNHIYLNPSDKNVALFSRVFQLSDPAPKAGINLPIDHFFRSLADDCQEQAVGIILSGTASDGSAGIKAIKEHGGMVMVQQPDNAQYPGMPQSAINTGLVDVILPVEELPASLLKYVRHPLLKKRSTDADQQSIFQDNIRKIFHFIRSKTGHDFSQYKQNTIRRRVERRMAIHQIAELPDYIRYLEKTPLEAETLFRELLIGVTGFFRDPEAFDILKETILPKFLETKLPDATLRIWIVGCSTGEEAYSLGILLSEVMNALKKQFNFQIFASDIDPRAIETARLGVYPESIVSDVSEERLRHYFSKVDHHFRIKKSIRDMVVFADHNLIKDPPFSRLDLLVCRNLLIYLDGALQKKIFPIFHFTLNPDGILFLGSSESIGVHTDLFKPLNPKWKIFQKKLNLDGKAKELYDYQPKNNKSIKMNGPNKKSPSIADVIHKTERLIFDTFAPAAVIINEKSEILHFIGSTDKFLAPPVGQASFNLLNMARENLKYQLSVLITKALQQKTITSASGIRFASDNVNRVADITVRPLSEDNLPEGLMLVIFEDMTATGKPKAAVSVSSGTNPRNRNVAQLEKELQSTREYLQSTIEEMETSNEELRSANEELQSVNEELQSANEELETSKEELHSTNEELSTVNAELQMKVAELSQSNDDMNNLLAASQIGTVFLDNNLCIKRFTPAMQNTINLITSDIGRPIDHITTQFQDLKISDYVREVLNTLHQKECEIQTREGHWYNMRILPYRTTENVIDGVVITFFDIQSVRQTRKLRRLATILQDSDDAILAFDLTGNIIAWNRGAEKMYGYSEPEALRMKIYAITRKKDHAEFDRLIQTIKAGKPVEPYNAIRISKTGQKLDVLVTATTLRDDQGVPVEVAITERNLYWLPTEKAKKASS